MPSGKRWRDWILFNEGKMPTTEDALCTASIHTLHIGSTKGKRISHKKPEGVKTFSLNSEAHRVVVPVCLGLGLSFANSLFRRQE